MSVRCFQIANGLGAGNIGDDLMALAFWDSLPQGVELDVAVFATAFERRACYPDRHRYIQVNYDGNESVEAGAASGLLVGDTPVTEAEGIHWPLRFLAPRLDYFHQRSLPVDAIGVGVDRLHSAEARALFRSFFLPIRSWTVRSIQCRDALLELGVAEHRILVGADWGWAYRRRQDLSGWAGDLWRSLGVDPRQPLLVINVVNLIWASLIEPKRAIAVALDELSRSDSFQIAFFCNEVRDGEFFDGHAARSVQALMNRPSVLVPVAYYSPDEVLALLSHASVTIAERYHFAVESVLAGTVPVNIVRGQKMCGLTEELGLPVAGRVDDVAPSELIRVVRSAVADRPRLLAQLDVARRHLAIRAANNLAFVRSFYGI